jgi:hypothetical protein
MQLMPLLVRTCKHRWARFAETTIVDYCMYMVCCAQNRFEGHFSRKLKGKFFKNTLGDLRNNVYFRQFFINNNAKLTPKVLGHLNQQDHWCRNRISFYTVLTVIPC